LQDKESLNEAVGHSDMDFSPSNCGVRIEKSILRAIGGMSKHPWMGFALN
jgi:hypothetical protein